MGKRENVKVIMDGFKSDPPKTDDEMLQQLYEECGVPFSDMRTVFNDIVKEKGLRLSNKERALKTIELMDGVEKIEDAEEMLKLVAMLQDKLKVTSTKAMGSLRTWAKANKIDLPKAPKVSKPRKVGFTGHYEKILSHIVAQRAAFEGEGIYSPDKKDVVAFCHAQGIPEAYSTTALNVVQFAQVWSGEIVEAADEPEAEVEEKEAA